MATSLLALLDDIATLLDDVALMTKLAAKKTAGVLGDDLALNAQQVSGVRAERELPVVWAVAKGSLRNKAILVPSALAISALAPWAVTPLLMFGGAYLCFEGVEKLVHTFVPDDPAEHAAHVQAVADPAVDLVALEQSKIQGAVRTDFILSAEIITISLGTVAKATFVSRVMVLTGIALAMTVGVYGLVAAIVKLDDAGLYLSQRPGDGHAARAQRWLGQAVLWTAPYLMKTLSVAGMVAMFLVGGGILTHGIAPLHHAIEHVGQQAASVAGLGVILGAVVPALLDGLTGVVAGVLVLLLVKGVQRVIASVKGKPAHVSPPPAG